MAEFATPPIDPMVLRFAVGTPSFSPAGPVLERRMSDLGGVFAAEELRAAAVADGDPLVYSVTSSPVPEIAGELPQSITTIRPGDLAGEFFMTKGHLHPDPQGEIYLALEGSGGLLVFDGTDAKFLPLQPGEIGYIPPRWGHRSVNVGEVDYKFLAVYPGSAGHDYQWVLEHGMGHRVYRSGDGYRLTPFAQPSPTEAG